MENVMLVNVVEEEEVRIAVLMDGKLQELYLERTGREHIVGNIHKGVVVHIVPNIEAAFVEFGYKKHGFLHVSDILPSAVGQGDRNGDIRKLVREGKEILVQVTKEGIGDKGPSLTTYLSLPGRYLVLMPGLSRRGVSRRITEDAERDRLRAVLKTLDIPKNMGIIARTAGAGRSDADIRRDVEYLQRLWQTISERAERASAPAMVYQESDPVTRVIRDYFTEDIRKVVVDSPEVYEKVREFLRSVMPHHIRKVKLHEHSDPLFHHYGVEQEIEKMHGRTVKLPSGGSIILEQTEALVAIDVNSGTYRGRGDAEQTAHRINLQAAPEIARQIRLRDLGGVVIIDFIDMEEPEHRRDVEKALWEALKPDRSRLRMLKMSPFCIVEMTRQRQRQSLRQSTYVECPSCRGSGQVKSNETLALQILREIKAGAEANGLERVEVRVGPQVANYLSNEMRTRLSELEEHYGRPIQVLVDSALPPGTHSLRLVAANGREVRPAKN
ncbi:MAG: Rne/Rng family ribonuclease [Candidatus Brocadiaceae bacterium]|nr:Rne/Rng family ribonuclease [Candidatus Brocadiaceae bacterium]